MKNKRTRILAMLSPLFPLVLAAFVLTGPTQPR